MPRFQKDRRGVWQWFGGRRVYPSQYATARDAHTGQYYAVLGQNRKGWTNNVTALLVAVTHDDAAWRTLGTELTDPCL